MPMPYYLVTWVLAMAVAAGVLWRDRRRHVICQRDYWRFLARPWRLATFTVAALSFVVVAPYTGDLTWDYVDAAGMSILTFATAPWTAPTLYGCATRRRPLVDAYVALCFALFAWSWFYDGYLLLRDGVNPSTWLVNLQASLPLYGAAAIFWSLDWRRDAGVHLAFRVPRWPVVHDEPLSLLLVAAGLPLMLLIAGTIGYFLLTG